MKSLALVCTASLCLAMLACSTAADPPMGMAGQTSSGGSSTAGANSGGAPSAGASTGGTSSTAGAAGAVVTGGAGGSDGGSGGTVAAGAGGTSSAGAGGSSGGAGGSTAGAGGAPDLLSVVGEWDGALVLYPCGNSGSGYDCAQPAAAQCVNNKLESATKTTWTIGGTAGTIYNVTFRVRGIVETTSYVGGTRDAGNASINANKDLFQVGGAIQQQGGPSYDYNTYQLDVTPAVASATANTYFLNSVTTAENPHAAGSPTTHLTFPIDYTKTIKVTGGGKVTLTVFDSNCTLVQNCGPTSGNQCSAPRTVALTGANPAPPATFMQPYQAPAGRYGQWVHFDITNVTVAQ